MKKSYTLFIIFILVCVYSCNNNYVVGPTNPTQNTHDTVLFSTMDSFSIYLNGVWDTINQVYDTIIVKDTTFNLALQGQRNIVLKYTGETNHPQPQTIIDSSADVKIVLGGDSSTLNVTDSFTVVFEDLDSTHLAGSKYLDTYRHTRFTFSKCHIRLRINHNHNYGDGQYFIRLKNLKFYRVT